MYTYVFLGMISPAAGYSLCSVSHTIHYYSITLKRLKMVSEFLLFIIDASLATAAMNFTGKNRLSYTQEAMKDGQALFYCSTHAVVELFSTYEEYTVDCPCRS